MLDLLEDEDIDRLVGNEAPEEPSRSLEHLDDRNSLTTGDARLDALLGGGMKRGCLNEVVGQR